MRARSFCKRRRRSRRRHCSRKALACPRRKRVSAVRRSSSGKGRRSVATRDLFASFADLMYRWRWFVIAFWFILLNAAAPVLAPNAEAALKGGGLILDNTQSAQADQVLGSEFDLSSQKNLVAVFYSPTLKVTDLDFQNQVTGAAAAISELSGVKAVTTYY